MRCGWKLKCSGYAVTAAFLLSCIEAVGLRAAGFAIGSYTGQITAGSFLYSVAIIGWLLKKSEDGLVGCYLLSRIGDCSYGSANSRWRVIKFENWYAYWISRFVLTAFVSFAIVCIGQMLLKDHKRLLRYIGFV